MQVPLWQALIAACVPLMLAAGVALPKLLSVRALNRQTDAKTLATNYGLLIDRLQAEVKLVREQYTSLQTRLDTRERELATLRSELATERSENSRLRGRVEDLERQVRTLPTRRHDDPPPPLQAV